MRTILHHKFSLTISSVLLFILPSALSARHFHLEKLSEGVYAAIAEKGGHSICNAGIIDLGNATMVIDPFLGLDAARALKDSAEHLTGKRVSYVVNTHYHDDHVSGNQVFAGAQIISTVRTRELMETVLPQELKAATENASAQLARLEKQDTSGFTPFEQTELAMMKGYFGTFVSNGSDVKIILPDVTFDDRMQLAGTTRSVELIAMGGGHTGSDLVVWLKKDSIIFTGDLLFIGHHPWLSDGNPEVWKSCLDTLEDYQVKRLVPGHGPTGSTQDLRELNRYIHDLQSIAMEYARSGKKPFGDPQLQIPVPYSGWYLSAFFYPNVYSLYGKALEK